MRALSLLALVSCAPTPEYPTAGGGRTPEQQAASALGVAVACLENGELQMGGGSAVMVAPDRALTAYHVVDCPGRMGVAVSTHSGEVLTVKVTRVHLAQDLALLELPKALDDYAPVRWGKRPARGARICLAAAVPAEYRRCGDVDRYNDDDSGDMGHDVVTEPGNSGSGIYDGWGRLVAVVTHLRRCGNGQYCGGYATSLEGKEWLVR